MTQIKIFEGNVCWIYDNGWYHFYCYKPNDAILISDEIVLENALIQTTVLPNAITVKGLETYKNGVKKGEPTVREMIINGNFVIHFE